MRLTKDVIRESLSVANRPNGQPVSEVFCYQHVLDRLELELLSRDPTFIKVIKGRASRELADHIIEKCHLFEIPSFVELRGGVPVRMELTINDRGAYENLIPRERADARKEGIDIGASRVTKSIPYGFEPNAYYE